MTYSVAGMPFADIKASFGRANYWSLPVLLLALVLFYVLKAHRWSLLLRPVKPLSARQITPALLIGFMANNLLPAHLGEFVRVFVLSKQFDIDKTPVLSTVVLERVFDIVAILLILGVSLPFISGMPADLQYACKVFGVVSLAGVAVLVIYMAFTNWFVATARRILNGLRFIPAKLVDGVVGMLETGAIGLESVRSPKLLLAISLSSIGQWMLNALMIFVSCWAFGVGAPEWSVTPTEVTGGDAVPHTVKLYGAFKKGEVATIDLQPNAIGANTQHQGAFTVAVEQAVEGSKELAFNADTGTLTYTAPEDDATMTPLSVDMPLPDSKSRDAENVSLLELSNPTTTVVKNPDYFDSVLVMGVIVFAILLPSPPGYFGVLQACFKLVLGEAPSILGASIYYHLAQYIPVTLIGLFFANKLGLSLGSLKAEAAASETEKSEQPE